MKSTRLVDITARSSGGGNGAILFVSTVLVVFGYLQVALGLGLLFFAFASVGVDKDVGKVAVLLALAPSIGFIVSGLLEAALGQLLRCIVKVEENTRQTNSLLADLLKLLARDPREKPPSSRLARAAPEAGADGP